MSIKKSLPAVSLIVVCFGWTVSAQAIENARRSTIGYIRSSSPVEDSSRRSIGYAEGVKPEQAAAFFFFFFKDAK